jgi:proteasome lid subunit RPN8/RPN11
MYAEILSHARESLPREAVGLIGGMPNGVARTVVPLSNLVPGGDAFFVDPYDQFVALRRLKEEGRTLVAIYHSHPGGGIEPSRLDLLYARRWNCAHLIVTVGYGGALESECRAFGVTSTGRLRDVAVAFV